MKGYRIELLRKLVDFGRPATTQEMEAAIPTTGGGTVSALQHLERHELVENVGRWYNPEIYLQVGTEHNSAVWSVTRKGYDLLAVHERTDAA